jgi:hypothetical protein
MLLSGFTLEYRQVVQLEVARTHRDISPLTRSPNMASTAQLRRRLYSSPETRSSVGASGDT